MIEKSCLMPKNSIFNLIVVNNIAQKWGTFQDVNFKSISQPFYVLLSPDLKVLNTSIQNSDIPTYKNWLLEGLNNNN